jgi:hypothetical protein
MRISATGRHQDCHAQGPPTGHDEHATGTQDARDEHADDCASTRSTTERRRGRGALPDAERGSQLLLRVGMLDCGISLPET